jgi:hypothetical protein
MKSFRTARVLIALLFLSCLMLAQQQPQPKAPAEDAQPSGKPPMDFGQLTEYVHDQFGASFKPTPVQPRGAGGDPVKGSSPIVLLTGDLDGDGVEDAIIVAKSINPMVDEQPLGYKVIDPYDTFFGYGNPKFTQQFANSDKDNQYLLLIVHSWRAETPKAKFVIINLPFDNLTVARGSLKKKTRSFLVSTQVGMMQSTIYWDGKKYRYAPGTSEEE